ncbi:hypothetical protein CRENBAI_008418 [Crenichthys baileyi]|uniref:Uncharacterized protein n=1 Tax=Crenichthys baileyi TaxID=28760 RepID=A0AAV9RF44_9TELE
MERRGTRHTVGSLDGSQCGWHNAGGHLVRYGGRSEYEGVRHKSEARKGGRHRGMYKERTTNTVELLGVLSYSGGGGGNRNG